MKVTRGSGTDPGRGTTPSDFFDGIDVAGADYELVALGGRLDVATLVAAYRAGCFPWPDSGPHQKSLEASARRLADEGEVPVLPESDPDPRMPLMPWMSPDPRPVLFADEVVVGRSLRQRLRRCGWETTVDEAFDEVIAGCASRPESWISPVIEHAYRDLHRAGIAHSLEVWSGDELVGGLYGVLTGRVFSGESMFHRASDASKVAVVDLCQRLSEAGVVVIDTEQESEHMMRLGQTLVEREYYVAMVRYFRDERIELPTDRRPVAPLAVRHHGYDLAAIRRKVEATMDVPQSDDN